MIEDDRFKLLFEHCFPLQKILSIMTIYTEVVFSSVGEITGDLRLVKIFDETKVNIEDMTTGDFEKLKKQSYLRGHNPNTRITIYRNPNN